MKIINNIELHKLGGSVIADGRRFKFKDTALVSNSRKLNNSRDMRKKFIKSDVPTYTNNRIKKGQEGLKFVEFNSIETPYIKPEIPERDRFVNPSVFDKYTLPKDIDKVPNDNTTVNKDNLGIVKYIPDTTEQAISYLESKVPTNKKDFIKTMRHIFKQALISKGLNPEYTDYLVAQSALESNWGKSHSGKNNLGGIKGSGTTRRTREVRNGKSVYENAAFKNFNSIDEYANHHVSLLNSKRYNAFNGGNFISNVVKGGYATDPNYSNLLNSIYKQIHNS